jgi:hypothetical protein
VCGDVLLDGQSRLARELLDVIGGSVVAAGPVQSRHGGDVLLNVRGQPQRLENLLDSHVVGDVDAGYRPVQCAGILRGESVDVEACRTGQFVDVTDAARRLHQDR